MKSFFLYFLAFTVSLSAFSVLLPVSNANAVSIWDNTLVQAPLPLTINNTSNSATYTFSSNDDIISSLTEGMSIIDNCSSFANRDTIVSQMQTRPYVIGTEYQGGGKYTVRAYVFSGSDPFVNYTGDGRIEVISTGSNTVSMLGMQSSSTGAIPQLYDCRVDTTFGSGTGFNFNNGHSANPNKIIAYKGFDFNFPPDYDGYKPSPIQTGTNYYPQVGYATTTENVLKALYTDGTSNQICIPVGLIEETGCVEPKLRWVIKDADDAELINSVKQLYEPFEYKFPSYAEYFLEVSFVHPGPPFAPFAPNVILVTTKIKINANGTFLVGSTDINDCTIVSGQYICDEASPFEDCSTYGVDIVGGFTCIINNFGIWLRNLLIDLFIPNSTLLVKSVNEFATSFQSQLGFLFTAFQMLTQWISALVSINPSCEFDFDGTFFGAQVDVNFCYFEQTVPTIYNILSVTVRLIMAAGFVFIAYRRLIQVVRDI